MAWRVHVLGDVRLVNGERTITRFESRKVVALLARLILEPGRLHAREELAALLWPDADRRTGLERLRHVLSSLQRQLAAPDSEPLLIVDRHGVRLNRAAVASDAADFESCIRRRQYKEARALYQGDLLPGYYDDWIQDERDRLLALYDTLEDEETDSEVIAPVEEASAPQRMLLPAYLTAFFGREEERAQVRKLLQERRFITLFGPGGSGKTRLAVEVCRDAVSDFDTVVFVSLAECVDPSQIASRLRAALRLPAMPGRETALDQVSVALGDGQALILLDNLEQIEEAGAAEAIESLLTHLPNIRCLATSRRLLHVAGEQAFPLAQLPVSEDATGDTESSGMALFQDRARLARPDFAIHARNRVDMAALCRLLDGIPLAIELMASRVRAYTIGEMRRQIEQEGQSRFVLAARPDAMARKDFRHGSLHAALAWSWRLLSPRHQEFLAALSVLHGRWSAGAAAAVCDVSDARSFLEELVASSLVISHPGEGEGDIRFSLLETIRAFVAEQLTPARRCVLRRANAAYILALVQDRQSEAAISEEDLPALHGVLEDSIEDGETDEALSLCAAFDDIWGRLGRSDIALELARRACDLPGGTAQTRAEALEVASYLAVELADLKAAAALAESAEASAVISGTPVALAAGRLATCRVAYRRLDPPEMVRRLGEEAIGYARAAGRPLKEATALSILGMLANQQGDFDEAERRLREAQVWMESLGYRQRANQIGINRGVVASDRGVATGDESHFYVAIARYEECLSTARSLGNRMLEALILGNIGAIYSRWRKWEESASALKEAIRRAQVLGYESLLGVTLWNLPESLAYTGRGAEAVPLLAFAERFWAERGGTITEEDIGYRDRVYAEARASLPGENPDAALAALIVRGEGLSLASASAFASRVS